MATPCPHCRGSGIVSRGDSIICGHCPAGETFLNHTNAGAFLSFHGIGHLKPGPKLGSAEYIEAKKVPVRVPRRTDETHEKGTKAEKAKAKADAER